MEIEKKYIDHRSNPTKDEKIPTVYTINFSNGEYCHMFTKWGRVGVNAHLSKLRRNSKVGASQHNAYLNSDSLNCTIEYFDDVDDAIAHLGELHGRSDKRCLTEFSENKYRMRSRGPVKPGAYTIYIGGCRYHGSSKSLNRRVKTHISKLKSNTHENKQLQKLFNDGHVPEFKFYITVDDEAARDLEWKLVKDDIESPVLLNEVLDTRASYHHKSKPCIIDGVEYRSIHAASRATGHSRELVRKMAGH